MKKDKSTVLTYKVCSILMKILAIVVVVIFGLPFFPIGLVIAGIIGFAMWSLGEAWNEISKNIAKEIEEKAIIKEKIENIKNIKHEVKEKPHSTVQKESDSKYRYLYHALPKLYDGHEFYNKAKFDEWCKKEELDNILESNDYELKTLKILQYFGYCVKEGLFKNIIVFDTETTGINIEEDYILSMGVVNGNGETIFDEMFKPGRRRKWTAASDVNGILYEDVKDKKLMIAYQEQISKIFDSADLIIGYNHEQFDLPLLQNESNGLVLNLKKDVVFFDVMQVVTPLIGKYSDYHGDYTWVKLTKAYSHYVGGRYKAHRSVDDAKATLIIFNKLIEK